MGLPVRSPPKPEGRRWTKAGGVTARRRAGGVAVGRPSPPRRETIVTTVPSKLYTIIQAGDLFVTLDSTPTRNRQLLANTLGETILRLQFRAQGEQIDVTDIQFTSRGSRATSVDRLELYKDGATTAFATATVVGCGTDQVSRMDGGMMVEVFCANMENGQLIVNNGENLDVLVRPRLKSDDSGALSNQQIQLFVSSLAVSDNATGQGAVRARGRTSSANLVANDGDAIAEGEVFIGKDSAGVNAEITGNKNVAVLSKITAIANANPDFDNTPVPAGVSAFGQFKFTASTNSNTLNGMNKATVGDIIFTVNSSNMWMNSASFKLYNKADSSVKASCIGKNSLGVPVAGSSFQGLFYVECRNLKSTTIDTQLDSGETMTLVLEADITNTKVSAALNSSLQASLDSFTDMSKTTLGITGTHIHWYDEDAASLSSGTTSSEQFWIEYPDTVVRSTLYKS